MDKTREEIVFFLDFNSLASVAGAKSRSNAAGPIDKIDCSKRSVKSKFERHLLTTGPKVLSLIGEQVEAIVRVGSSGNDLTWRTLTGMQYSTKIES